MPSRTIGPAILAVVAATAIVYTRVRRGRRLLVLRERPSALRWVLNGVFLAVAILGLVASAKSAKGPWDSISSLSLILFVLSDLGFDVLGRAPAGHCAFHQNGVLTFDGRRPVFSMWDEIERFEWHGETLMFHRVAQGLAHLGEVISVDVPPERRGDVMAVIATHVRG